MDEVGVRRAWWDSPALVEALAAFAVGMAFMVPASEFPGTAGYGDLFQSSLIPPAALACALLVLGVSATTLLPRLPAWPLVVGALLVALAADGIADGAELVLTDHRPVARIVAVLAGLEVGLALGGVLLAVAQAPRSVRWLISGGLAAGLVLQPVSVALVPALLGGRESVSSVTVQLGFAALAAVCAALVAYRRGRYAPLPASGRPAVAPVVVVCATGGLLAAGLAVRSSLTGDSPLPGSLSDYDRQDALAGFGQWSLVLLVVAVGVVLLGHAYRVGGVVAARWVLLCLGAGPVALLAGQTIRAARAGTRYPMVLAAVAGVALVAVAAGAAFGRYAPARAVPWDALGLLVAAVAMYLSTPVVRAELPSRQLLTFAGLGLAVAFGLSQAAWGLPGPDSDPPPVLGLLVTGPAALVLSALALAPVVIRSLSGVPEDESLLTVPGHAAAIAVLLVLLLGISRAVERFGRDPGVEPGTGTASSAPVSPGGAEGPTR